MRSCAASCWFSSLLTFTMRTAPAAGGACLGQALDKGLPLALRRGTREAVDRLSLAEGINRRDRLDAELRGELLVLVDVDLHHAHGAGGGLHGSLQQRP